MHRFPNPGSTIENFIAVYVAAFDGLNGHVINLDDIVDTVVKANLATSSGYMGEEAVQRSTRRNRSRDPLYNQLKMYAELFRVLGWLQSTERSRLKYTFTLLGKQIHATDRERRRLFSECALGIVYPNRLLTVRGDYELRPFAHILRTMRHANGILSRDEMIVGPLNAQSDVTAGAAQRLGAEISRLRTDQEQIPLRLSSLAKERGTQVNTLHNYTRWPLAVLRYCGWISEATAVFENGRNYRTWELTPGGAAIAERLESMVDVRLRDLDQLPAEEKAAVIFHGHFALLARAGFDISPVVPLLSASRAQYDSAIRRISGGEGGELLFSPFQSLSVSEIDAAFPSLAPAESMPSTRAQRIATASPIGRGSRDHLFVTPKLVSFDAQRKASDGAMDPGAGLLRAKLSESLKAYPVEEVADVFVAMHTADNKLVFYPLITHLFQILGCRSEHSRIGVNYQRWDASVWVDGSALPVEIKSPTEEAFLSTKSVRQALENKIVLLSRGGLITDRDLSSLIVGYNIPNERGELSMLIDDIYKAYGFRIGAIDLRSLVVLTCRAIAEGVTIDPSQLALLCGFLNV